MSELTRIQVVTAVRAALHAELDALAQMTAMARDEATADESRPENKYDTRAIEASYLAAGQGARLADLRRLTAWADRVDVQAAATVAAEGALVHIELAGATQWVLLAPQGGLQVDVGGQRVRLISSRSPLGRVLVGLEPGDSDEVSTPRGAQELVVDTVC